MKVSNDHLIFIYSALFCHIVASVLTYWYVGGNMAIECNPFMAAGFDMIGLAGMLILSNIAVVAAMLLLWYTERNREVLGLRFASISGILVVTLGLDALNDIFVVTDNEMHELTILLFKVLYSKIGFGC